jgi:glucosamine--fructose-6-phosphate aminotransferase (isomerizing)
MCGIFGYLGKQNNAGQIVLEGLKLLEYRGYDSWGVGVEVDKEIVIDKHKGKIGDAKVKLPNSNFAFGHTRWATHGKVTDINAHPHRDCTGKIAVVHNGIIENYQEIKKTLGDKHKIISETDTEVFAHLIEDYYKNHTLIEAVRLAFLKLRGLSAFLVADGVGKTLVAVKTGSPLVIGIGKEENVVGSDFNCLLHLTRNVIFLEENQLAEVTKNNVSIFSIKTGKKIKSQIQRIDWKEAIVTKGNFPHFLLKEIYEQPRVIENIALTYKDLVEKLAYLIKRAFGTFMLGCGTASYAALYGTYAFSKIAKKHVNFSIGSEFNYLEDYLTKDSLVIPISQSGETIDVLEPVYSAKKKGATIVAIVNVLGSSLYRHADYKILLNAGLEKAVVGTKSFIAMVSVLLLTAYAYIDKQESGKALLLKAARNVQKLLENSFIAEIKKVAKSLKDKEHIYIIGRGLSYAAALEASLKIKETSYIHAEGFAGGELKHGVIALIDKGTPCIVIAPNDETYDDIISNAQEIKARGGMIIGIGPKNNTVFDRFLETDDLKEATIIPQIVISQLLAYNLAIIKAVEDPDKPRNLAKSVTVK